MLCLLVGNGNLIGVQLDAKGSHFTKPSGYGEVNLFRKQVAEFMEGQCGVMGDHRLRFSSPVAAPETQLSQMLVWRERVGAEPIQAVSCPLPAPLPGVMMLGWIAVAQLQGLRCGEVPGLGIYQRRQFLKPVAARCHTKTFNIIEGFYRKCGDDRESSCHRSCATFSCWA